MIASLHANALLYAIAISQAFSPLISITKSSPTPESHD
jgi:hypothetical protein